MSIDERKFAFEKIIKYYNQINNNIINIQVEIANLLDLQDKNKDSYEDIKLINLLKVINSNIFDIHETHNYYYNNICYHQNKQIDIITFKNKMLKAHNEIMRNLKEFRLSLKELIKTFEENKYNKKYNEGLDKLISILNIYEKAADDSLYKFNYWVYTYK